MAAITIPEPLAQYVPQSVDPSLLWVQYNHDADSLVIYFTGEPVPTVWDPVDEYVYLGFALDDDTVMTGMMIEHFSKWLLITDHTGQAVGSV